MAYCAEKNAMADFRSQCESFFACACAACGKIFVGHTLCVCLFIMLSVICGGVLLSSLLLIMLVLLALIIMKQKCDIAF